RSTTEEIQALVQARGLEGVKDESGKSPTTLWERVVDPPRRVALELRQETPGTLIHVPVANGLALEYRVETIPAEHAESLRLATGGRAARAVSVFLVNARTIVADRQTHARAYTRELNE